MRKQILFYLLCMLLTAYKGNSQSFYLRGGGGYAFGLNRQTISFGQSLQYFNANDFINVTDNSDGSTTWENVYVSLGKGYHFNIAAAYLFNKNIGAEMGVGYLISAKHTALFKEEYAEVRYDLSSKMFSFNPSLIVCAGYEKVNPFLKLGFLIGFGEINHYSLESSNNTETGTMNVKLNGGLSKGFNAALGTDFMIGKNLALFAECSFSGMTYAPNTAEMTELTVNGEDVLNQYEPNFRKIKLLDSYTEDYEYYPTGTIEVKRLKQVFQYSSACINAGLKINF